jgi:hypothetical protein
MFCADGTVRATLLSSAFDLRPYSSARLRFEWASLFEIHEQATSGGGGSGEVRVIVKSNVPGTDDLSVLWKSFRSRALAPQLTSSDGGVVDVSLENALGFGEATVQIFLRLDGWCSACSRCGDRGRLYPASARVEVRDLEVVGSR